MRVLSRTNRGQNYLLWRARDNDKHICYNSFAIYTSKKKCQKEKTMRTEKKQKISFESTSSCASTASGLLPSLIHFNS